jgi:hypothetical protein
MSDPGNRPPTIDSLLDERIDAAVRRHAADLRRPEFVHQRDVEAVCGLPRRTYLALARSGAIPSTKMNRLVIARTIDVVTYVEQRIASRPDPGATQDQDDLDELRQSLLSGLTRRDRAEAVALARVGARRIS